MKKICFITGSRSEFGLMKNLIKKCYQNKQFKIHLIVTGSHLLKEHGFTFKEIIKENIKISKKVKIIDFKKNKNTPVTISAISLGIRKFEKVFRHMDPDLVCIPCDRYEMLGPALAAFFLNIPIAHFFGGEVSYGSQDDTIRHTLTKLSNYHFVTHKTHKKRVIQMGEDKKKVFTVGNLTIDNIINTKLYNIKNIQKLIKFKTDKKNLLVTFHPITNIPGETVRQFSNLLKALSKFKDVNMIFTSPNADVGNLKIKKMIQKFMKKNKNASLYKSLGHRLYYSLLKNVDCVVGNSSSGLTEAPFLGATTLNIGNRQLHRLQAGKVVNVKANTIQIKKKINQIIKKKIILKIKNKVYLKTGATKNIIQILKKINLKDSTPKKFLDLNKVF